MRSYPDFHNTVSRYNQLLSAINDDKAKRAQSCRELTEKFLSRKDYCDKVIKEIDAGNIPVRVTHNDTKLNNALIDMESKEALAVLDLDTVMPGSILYDFGDSIRYGANTGAEDEKGFDKGRFRYGTIQGVCQRLYQSGKGYFDSRRNKAGWLLAPYL